MGHVTLTTPLIGVVCHPKARTYIVYMCAKYDDSIVSAVPEIIGAAKFKMGHVILTTPPFKGDLSSVCSIRITEDRDRPKWRKYVHGVANPRIEDG